VKPDLAQLKSNGTVTPPSVIDTHAIVQYSIWVPVRADVFRVGNIRSSQS
jgi:hypothetical protein